MQKILATAVFDGQNWLPQGTCLLTDDQGTIRGFTTDTTGATVYEGIICPGFVNAHCHLELSAMRGVIPEGTGLPAFLKGVVTNRSTPDSEAIGKAIAEADTAMWQQGINVVGDISNNSLTAPQKSSSPIYYHTFVETIGFVPQTADRQLEQSQQVRREFQAHDNQLQATIVPHAPYSVSTVLFEKIGALNEPVSSLHNQETPAENQFFETGEGPFRAFYEFLGLDLSTYSPSGKTSLQTYWPAFAPQQNLLLVHNTFSSAEDIAFTHQQNASTYWCLCPNANLYIEQSLPDVELLRSEGCHLVVGTDSLASNHQLNILAELQTLHQHFPGIPVGELLQWATHNGAQALKVDHHYGSFSTGKQPGILLLQLATPTDLSTATVRRLF
jgi:cytosine/adenosine deaminase-related metal-dependent hydrolase